MDHLVAQKLAGLIVELELTFQDAEQLLLIGDALANVIMIHPLDP